MSCQGKLVQRAFPSTSLEIQWWIRGGPWWTRANPCQSWGVTLIILEMITLNMLKMIGATSPLLGIMCVWILFMVFLNCSLIKFWFPNFHCKLLLPIPISFVVCHLQTITASLNILETLWTLTLTLPARDHINQDLAFNKMFLHYFVNKHVFLLLCT